MLSWREKGFTVVQLPDHIWSEAYKVLHKVYPEERPENFPRDFGSPDGIFEFPASVVPTDRTFRYRPNGEDGVPELDDLYIHEAIIKIAQVLLKTPEVKLTQGDAWCKYAPKSKESEQSKSANTDQRIHMDYGNHTFTHPGPWSDRETVTMILYFDDSEICSGGTAAVPRFGDEDELYKPPYINMPGQQGLPFINDRQKCESWFKENRPDIYEFRQKLYAREKKTVFNGHEKNADHFFNMC